MTNGVEKPPGTATGKAAANYRGGNSDQDSLSRSERTALCLKLRDDLGGRYDFARVQLEHYEVYHDQQTSVLARLNRLTPRLPEIVKAGCGLIFLGTVGTGKDHLLAAMLYLAAGRHELKARWLNGQEFYGTLRDRMDSGRSEDEFLRRWTEPVILGISDPTPAVGRPSPWNLLQLGRLIDRRYRALRSTWITLNAVSVEEAEEKLTSPVFDRLKEGAEIFTCDWPSYRERRVGRLL